MHGGNINGSGGSGGGSGGPCGACKFLRRKCVKGCIFAPYFDSEQGATHFAAVHKIFGASNVSKLLLRLPAHKRLDAVVTICYEALARMSDPVYGCVGHIFALQRQVVNLQAELAFVQAHLSTMELSSSQSIMIPTATDESPALANIYPSSSAMGGSSPNVSTDFGSEQLQTPDASSYCGLIEQPVDDGDLHALAREFVSRYLPGARVQSSSSC